MVHYIGSRRGNFMSVGIINYTSVRSGGIFLSGFDTPVPIHHPGGFTKDGSTRDRKPAEGAPVPRTGLSASGIRSLTQGGNGMVIAESSIGMASQYVSVESYQKTESLKAWVGDARPNFEGETPAPAAAKGDTVNLSGQVPTQAAQAGAQVQDAEQATGDQDQLEPKYRMLKLLIERLLKTKIHMFNPQQMEKAPQAQTAPQAQSPQGVEAAAAPQRAGYGVEYNMTESRYEMEQSSFAASGVIKTADGQEINFNLSLSMTREYASQTSVSLNAGDAVRKDPLVLNFDGTAAELSSTRFSFDINADGTNEQVASLKGNSAYLALDKNGDGKINNGSELFGPTTGNGFNELSSYDSDHNGWIDEKDAVFSQLKTWVGGDTLRSLKDAGVGAIYLGNQQTPFSIKNSDNALLGAVKSSGIFLNENGSVGSVQQIDLAV